MLKTWQRCGISVPALLAVGLCVSAPAHSEGPQFRPGQLPLSTERLEPVNLMMNWASFDESGETTSVMPLLVEYEELIHEWQPTGQVRWLTIGGDSPAYDLMLVALDTFRIKIRHEPLPDKGVSVRTWMDGAAAGGEIHPDGSVTTWVHPTDEGVFDIATFPFLFSAVDWDKVPKQFQLAMARYESKGVVAAGTQWYDIRDGGMTNFRDAHGNERRVRQVSILNYRDNRRVDYYVSPEPPFWIGMTPRSPEDDPTSSVRISEYELREVTLSEHIEDWMRKRPDK